MFEIFTTVMLLFPNSFFIRLSLKLNCHFGIRTFSKPCLAAVMIFSFIPPTTPITSPEFIVPVITVFSSSFKSSRTAIVRIVIAEPALGPPTIAELALIV